MYRENLKILRCPVCGPEGKLKQERLFESAPDDEILEALLTCLRCNRWYRIEEGIADLMRDGLREVEADRYFLQRHEDEVPSTILRFGVPFGLTGDLPAQTEADKRIVDEGRHWGRFMRRFWDVDDRSIFDIRIKSTHPPFYVAGILERDDRDQLRRWGIFPDRTGNVAFGALGHFAGRLGVDVGCGGGQFGLEAAQQGVRMIGFDPSFEEVDLARQHARERGVVGIDYVRAEPAHPPFAEESVDLMMAKDSLHHVPELRAIFPRLLNLMKPGATFVCHEHCARPRIKNKLMRLIQPRAIEKIRSRYPKHEIPQELLTDSANEDVSMDAVRAVVREHFIKDKSVEDLFLASDFEMLAHFAYGKRWWVTKWAWRLGSVIERTLLLLGDRQHLTFVGRKRGELKKP